MQTLAEFGRLSSPPPSFARSGVVVVNEEEEYVISDFFGRITTPVIAPPYFAVFETRIFHPKIREIGGYDCTM